MSNERTRTVSFSLILMVIIAVMGTDGSVYGVERVNVNLVHPKTGGIIPIPKSEPFRVHMDVVGGHPFGYIDIPVEWECHFANCGIIGGTFAGQTSSYIYLPL